MRKTPLVRCEHCGQWVKETETVTAYADTGCIAQACFEANSSKAFWRAWVFARYPEYVEHIKQREASGEVDWFGAP